MKKNVALHSAFLAAITVFTLYFTGCNIRFAESYSGETGPQSPEYSSIYPFGMQFQLHENSSSVNTPVRSSGLMNSVRNPAASFSLNIPAIPSPQDYSAVLYFDSESTGNGDGSFESPYTSLKYIMEGSFPDDCAMLLKAGSVFTSSFLRTGPDDEAIYFGSYGSGPMPIVTTVDSLSNPASLSGYFAFDGNNITIDGIHIVGGAFGSYGRVASLGATGLTIANSHIESIKTSFGYCHNIFKGGAANTVLYNNEIAYAREDIWYASSQGTYYIAANYFHHANMGTYKDSGDPRDRETWTYYKGDIIQLEYPGLSGAYIAGNFFDRSDSASKFALIFNGGQDNSGVVVEYNTFIGPLAAYGGAAVQWHTLGTFRNNLIINVDTEGGVSGLATYAVFAEHITGNHFAGYNTGTAFYNISALDLSEDNLVFESVESYLAGVAPEDRRGSPLF